MKGIEKQVLNIIKKLEEADKESVGFKLGVSTKYVVQICSILTKDGYLEEKPDGEFKLTFKGKEFTGLAVKARKPLIRW
ncbi:MAG: hypothetical protein RAO92_00135 [Candidatus Euphemobacter frigidus]|nr:hypothetical protein [Candidatus Euphemobacter frigidus]MDP8274786.1 hypothetical protein [Candidatus Euphemobacter frigidus]